MARRRMIDPNIWESEDFSKLSIIARLLFIGMFSLADDEGKGRAKAVYLKSVVFPYDDKIRIIDVETALSEIGLNMSVTFYAHNDNSYYRLDNWSVWQRVDKPQPSKIPDPTPINDTTESFRNHSRIIPESFSPKRKEEKGSKEKGSKEKRKEEKETRAREGFDLFWSVYPKRTDKAGAFKAFEKLNPDEALLSRMIDAINTAKNTDEWTREEGRYIPHASNWLNKRRWEDDYRVLLGKPKSKLSPWYEMYEKEAKNEQAGNH